MKTLNIFLILFSALVFIGCDKSKITESDLPANQKMLSLCVTPWEQTFQEGAKVIAYMSDTAACNETCQSVEFTCQKGRFVPGANVKAGITIANTKQFCKQDLKCACQLPAGKGKVSDGITTKVYTTAQVACGQVCSSAEKEVICKNGKFFDVVDQSKEVTNYNFSCSIEDCKSCNAPWDSNLRAIHGGHIIGYIKDKLTCGFSCEDTKQNAIGFTCDNGTLRPDAGALTNTPSTLKTSCIASTDCACKSATGQSYVHDKATIIKLTKKQTGTCDVACDAAIDYTCEEGKFVNQITKAIETAPLYESCSDTCKYCQFPNGQTVKQGTEKEFFKNTAGTCAQACQVVKIRCDAGPTGGVITVLTGGPANYTDYKENSCSDTCVTCKLPDNSNLVENTETDLFTKDKSTCTEACSKIRVVCDKASGKLKNVANGNVVDVAVYKSLKCVDGCVRCTMPDGNMIDAPAYSMSRWAKDKVACGQSCDSQYEQLHCYPDGKVTKGTNYTSIPIENFKFTSCSVETCQSCSMPWSSDSTLNNGATAKVFKKSQAACGERCDDLAIQVRCTDSKLNIFSGDPNANLSQMVTSCSNATCPTCTYNGREYKEGERLVAYKYDGSSCSLGACADYKTFTCNAGSWKSDDNANVADYKFGSCVSQCVPADKTETGRQPGDSSAESGGAFTWLCPVLHSRGFAWDQTKLSYYSKAKVACGDSCNRYLVEVKCDTVSGLFNNTANPKSVQMLYMNCVEQCP